MLKTQTRSQFNGKFYLKNIFALSFVIQWAFQFFSSSGCPVHLHFWRNRLFSIDLCKSSLCKWFWIFHTEKIPSTNFAYINLYGLFVQWILMPFQKGFFFIPILWILGIYFMDNEASAKWIEVILFTLLFTKIQLNESKKKNQIGKINEFHANYHWNRFDWMKEFGFFVQKKSIVTHHNHNAKQFQILRVLFFLGKVIVHFYDCRSST